MTQVPRIVEKLWGIAASDDLVESDYALARLGLLIEKHCQERHADTIYSELGFDEELNNLRLNSAQINQIAKEMVVILMNDPTHAGRAAWSLGKTFDIQFSPDLYVALERYWKTNDIVTAEIIAAIYFTGYLEDRKYLIEEIARNGSPESRDAAQQALKRSLNDAVPT